MSRLFHISPVWGLSVLKPSMPADDIIGGKFVKQADSVTEGEYLEWRPLPPESACVSFSANLEVNLKHTHIGPPEYIYEPIYDRLVERPRPIYLEITPGMKETSDIWVDYDDVLECRFYTAVPIKAVGKVHWGKKGIDIYITWYKGHRTFISVWDGVFELVWGKRKPIVRGSAPWCQQ